MKKRKRGHVICLLLLFPLLLLQLLLPLLPLPPTVLVHTIPHACSNPLVPIYTPYTPLTPSCAHLYHPLHLHHPMCSFSYPQCWYQPILPTLLLHILALVQTTFCICITPCACLHPCSFSYPWCWYQPIPPALLSHLPHSHHPPCLLTLLLCLFIPLVLVHSPPHAYLHSCIPLTLICTTSYTCSFVCACLLFYL